MQSGVLLTEKTSSMHKHLLALADFRESLVMAIAAIRSSKLRSILTILGIVVGIFSIISVMTALGVLRNSIEQGMTQLGANTFQVQKFSRDFNTTPEQRRKMRNRRDLTYEQALQVQDKASLASAVGIEIVSGGKIVYWEGKATNPNIAIFGESVEGITTNDWTVEMGRGLNNQDVNMAQPVIVLGQAVVEKLFPPSVNPVGESVRIDNGVYRIIGLFEKKGSVLGGNQDNFVVIPITTYFHKYGKDSRSLHIMVQARNRNVMDDAIEQVRGILRTARKVPPGAEDDFSYFSNDSLITQFNEFTFYLRLGVLVVSSISLVAAGVGIMNIMLVSVTERTREIGIRKSIGAEKSDILSQFITEAVILCEIGGILGVLLGIGGGNIVSVLTGAPAIIPWDWTVIGLVACSLVGLVFGVYPAWKAANLDPIEALRYE
jgi:putative ABC transport system permease protein